MLSVVLGILVLSIIALILANTQTVPTEKPTSPEGESVRLLISNSLEKGKPVVLFLSQANCPACKAQKPIWAEMRNQYGDKVDFILIEYMLNDTDLVLEAFALYEVRVVPTFVFIDLEENIWLKREGFIPKDEFTDIIKDFLEAQEF